MRVKEESGKAGLKFNKFKKLRSWHPVGTVWQIDEEKVEAVTGFIFFVSKISADGDCSHEIKDAYSLEGKL